MPIIEGIANTPQLVLMAKEIYHGVWVILLMEELQKKICWGYRIYGWDISNEYETKALVPR